MKFKDIKIGQEFKWCNLTWVKLTKEMFILNNRDGIKGYYCIFDSYDNKYKDSLIRYYVNNKFLKINKIKTGELKPFSDGDYAKLLSLEEYKKYKDLIKPMASWWLRSPYADYGSGAWCVHFGGLVFGGSVDYAYGVRPAFKSTSEMSVEAIPKEVS